MELYPHQKTILESTAGLSRVGYFLEMGLGKTFVSSEKAKDLGADILIVCPKSLLSTWKDHYKKYYPEYSMFDLTNSKQYTAFFEGSNAKSVAFINYDLIFRRSELATMRGYTLLLDESSLIKNETAKRTKFILNRLKPDNVILCSGSVCGGKYEQLWSQMRLLGWDISKKAFWNKFIRFNVDMSQGFPITYVYGYKRVDDLKEEINRHGGRFMKSEDVITLPEQVFTTIKCEVTPEYRKFKNNSIVKVDMIPEHDGLSYLYPTEIVGDTVLTKLLYMRMLCGQYNKNKIQALRELIQSTDDRLIIFYNFNEEFNAIKGLAYLENRPLSIVSGATKDLTAYEKHADSITAIQIQAGAFGLNLQKANKIVYFTPPLSSELFEQSKKRTHRLGQERTCFYWFLICENSIEEKIYDTLAKRNDYSNELFKGEFY